METIFFGFKATSMSADPGRPTDEPTREEILEGSVDLPPEPPPWGLIGPKWGKGGFFLAKVRLKG